MASTIMPGTVPCERVQRQIDLLNDEPCDLLIKKLGDHNCMVKCPYCKSLFDAHVGLIFVEGKETVPPPRDTHEYFEQVMS